MIRYSVITPSRGDRPAALRQALASALEAARAAGLEDNVELLVGFDGRHGERVIPHPAIRYVDLPADNDLGNAIRHALIRAARGTRLVFLDDDNILLPDAFTLYEQFPDADMLVASIDTSRAFPDVPRLPRPEGELLRQGNIDPLCLCVTRDLVLTRCGGWMSTPAGTSAYSTDYLNIRHYARRAATITRTAQVVGVYDAGRGLDRQGMNPRQQQLETQPKPLG